MARARNAVFPIALAILVGCGGGGSVSNAAHLRFFDALNDTTNVRLYVGGRLYKAGGDASIENGDDPRYGDVPSGTGLSLVVNRYANLSSGGDASALATLTAQTLLAGKSYTAVALLTGTTKKLVLLSDNAQLDSATAYFRIVNANNTTTPLYLQVLDKESGSFLYETSGTAGFASGGNTGLQSDFFGNDATSQDAVVHVYRDAAFTDEIASTTVTLSRGKAVTTFIYNRDSGSGLSFKSSTDRDTNVTTSTTGTDGTTATDGTTTTAGTTSTAGGTGTTATAGTTATSGTTAG